MRVGCWGDELELCCEGFLGGEGGGAGEAGCFVVQEGYLPVAFYCELLVL